ncbi:Uncharacterised protein [Mycobacteroides abscessus subsp. abscessus]|nr:Uncharacterised protein [Mycobacteroides abscessus subsp. abscessus]
MPDTGQMVCDTRCLRGHGCSCCARLDNGVAAAPLVYGRLRLHPALVAKLDPAVALEVSPLRLLRRCHEGTPVGLTCTAG